jgi:hypothetical protein
LSYVRVESGLEKETMSTHNRLMVEVEALIADRDSWRRVAETLEREKAAVEAEVTRLTAERDTAIANSLEMAKRVEAFEAAPAPKLITFVCPKCGDRHELPPPVLTQHRCAKGACTYAALEAAPAPERTE